MDTKETLERCVTRSAKVVVERWRRKYNYMRPHSSLGYQAPTPEVIIPIGA